MSFLPIESEQWRWRENQWWCSFCLNCLYGYHILRKGGKAWHGHKNGGINRLVLIMFNMDLLQVRQMHLRQILYVQEITLHSGIKTRCLGAGETVQWWIEDHCSSQSTRLDSQHIPSGSQPSVNPIQGTWHSPLAPRVLDMDAVHTHTCILYIYN